MFSNSVLAQTSFSTEILDDMQLQNHISEIGFRILNANKIDRRMIFVYDKKNVKIKKEEGLTKRQIIIYKDSIKFASDDSEIAAFLAREICKSAESYTGPWKGFVSAAQVKIAPKRYEILFDKRAVDFMVAAGYNPLALITFMNKAYEQKRFDKISAHNLTSKRLAEVYEYIFIKYPYFLENNEYIENPYYQNFLLSSIENRKIFERKLKYKTVYKVKYE